MTAETRWIRTNAGTRAAITKLNAEPGLKLGWRETVAGWALLPAKVLDAPGYERFAQVLESLQVIETVPEWPEPEDV